MKRKSDSDIDLIDNELITKSLRRSVSNFLNENSINMSVLSEKKNLEFNLEKERWERYHKILDTYTPVARSIIPKELLPTICATYGWKFSENNFLQCEECNKLICISIPKRETMSRTLYLSCIRTIQKKLTDAHSLTCTWILSKKINLFSIYNIQKRYKILEEAKINVVSLKPNIIDKDKLNCFKELSNEFYLIIAICGWTPSKCGNPNRLKCILCGRDLSLLIFSDKYKFNSLEHHFSDCPIINKEKPLWRKAIDSCIILKSSKDEKTFVHVARTKLMINKCI